MSTFDRRVVNAVRDERWQTRRHQQWVIANERWQGAEAGRMALREELMEVRKEKRLELVKEKLEVERSVALARHFRGLSELAALKALVE